MTVPIDTAGIHPTTISCLEALQWLQGVHAFARVLDMGCGDGLLSQAAAGMWKADVLAADIAPEAVEATRRQSAALGMEGLITAIRSDGFQHALIKERAPYDLILFNLLAEPIVQMAPQVRQSLAPGGICLLSGILEWMAAEVEAAYRALGFETLHQITRTPWRTYILRRQKEAA